MPRVRTSLKIRRDYRLYPPARYMYLHASLKLPPKSGQVFSAHLKYSTRYYTSEGRADRSVVASRSLMFASRFFLSPSCPFFTPSPPSLSLSLSLSVCVGVRSIIIRQAGLERFENNFPIVTLLWPYYPSNIRSSITFSSLPLAAPFLRSVLSG